MPVWVVLCLAALVVRYRRAGQVERQQIKWLLFATAVFAAAYIPVFLVTDFDFGPNPVFWSYLWMAAMLLIPASIGIAILRYRLYDIDLIIRKTLVYSVLSGLLALVYFGGVVLLQRLFGALTGVEGSPLAVVVSTLAIAASSPRCAAASRTRLTGASTARSTTRSRCWRNSPSRRAMRPTWRR